MRQTCDKPRWMHQKSPIDLPVLGAWLVIALACAVRVRQYAFNRSLWADEATLALNIIQRSYGELLQPLDYDQGAPLGFLMGVKLATQLLGVHEYALRLLPLIGGIAALTIFYYTARQYLQGFGVVIAVLLLGFIEPVVYYSTEVKQYSTDVAIALIGFWLVSQLQIKSSKPGTIVRSLAGAILIWCSHPAILVLAGATGSLLLSQHLILQSALQRHHGYGFWRSHWQAISSGMQRLGRSRHSVVISISWLLSFLLFYWVSISDLSANSVLEDSWQARGAFPDSYNPISNAIWAIDRLGRVFYSPLDFSRPWDGVAIAAFVVGCISLGRRQPKHLRLLLSPLLATLLAAYLHQYPFDGRLLLFLTPFLIVIMAEGIHRVITWPNLYAKGAGLVLVAMLLSQPLQDTLPFFHRPDFQQEIKPVLEYVQIHQQPGDVLYVYQRGIRQFEFYAKRYGYGSGDYVAGVDDLDAIDGPGVSATERIRYQEDLDQLQGNARVWILFSHAWVMEEVDLVTTHLDCLGNRIDQFNAVGAFVYLYDLSQPPSSCRSAARRLSAVLPHQGLFD